MTDTLIETAIAARLRAHAPYSGFRVGAALRCDDDTVHAGCNVENAAYPQGVCAEAAAICAMVLAGAEPGGRRIVAIVIAAGGGQPCPPCGGCRQKIREFAPPEAAIVMVDEHGTILMQSSLGELLPHSFGPNSLGFPDGR